MKKTPLIALAALVTTLALPIAAKAQNTTTVPSTTANVVNNTLVDSGRIGLGAIGILGKNESGSFSRGLSFQKTDAVITLDVFRYKTPIGSLKGETSFGVYLSTNDISLKNGSFGPQINYSADRIFIGLAYVGTGGENKGQFIIGRRL